MAYLAHYRKRTLDCSFIEPAVERSSTSKPPEDGPCKRISLSDQTSTELKIGLHDGTKGSVSRLNLVDVCGSDVVPTQVSRANSTDNREKSPLLPLLEGLPSNNSRGVQFQTVSNHYSCKSGEGNEQTDVPNLFCRNAPAKERAWRGTIKVDCGMIRLSAEVTAHLSTIVSHKACECLKKIKPTLQFKLLSRSEGYPRIFQDSCPTIDDIALYFYPAKNRPKDIYAKLLRDMKKKDLMMLSHIDGIELLLFPSTILPAGSQRLDSGNHYFIWGLFRRRGATAEVNK